MTNISFTPRILGKTAGALVAFLLMALCAQAQAQYTTNAQDKTSLPGYVVNYRLNWKESTSTTIDGVEGRKDVKIEDVTVYALDENGDWNVIAEGPFDLVVPEWLPVHTGLKDKDGNDIYSPYFPGSIGDNCFNTKLNKSQFKSISLPKDIQVPIPSDASQVEKFAYSKLGQDCFNTDNTVLKKVTFYASDGLQYAARYADVDNFVITDKPTLQYTMSRDETQTADITDLVVPQSLKLGNLPEAFFRLNNSVEEYFKGNTSLHTVTFVNYNGSDREFRINNNSFQNCYNLTSITLPDCKLTIASGAFKSCANLATVVIPATYKTFIGAEAFSNCPNLRAARWGDGVYTMGAGAFNGTDVTSLVLPASLQSWPKGDCFTHADGSKLKALVLPTQFDETDEYSIKASLENMKTLTDADTKVYLAQANYDELNTYYADIPGQKTPYMLYKQLSMRNSALLTTVCLPGSLDADNSYNVKGVYTITGAQQTADGTYSLKVAQVDNAEADKGYVVERNNDAFDANRLVVYAYKQSGGAGNDSGQNLLTGLGLDTDTSATYDEGDYILQSDDIFHRVGSAYQPKHAAGSAFIEGGTLARQGISATAKLAISIEGGATGISAVSGVSDAAGTAIYNVAGQRVAAPVKGQLYIQGGKKFIQR